MKTVKYQRVLALVMSCLFFNAYSMMPAPQDRGSLELQLANGDISAQNYLLLMERNSNKWGLYSTKVRQLRMSGYSNYHANLYNHLLYVIDEAILPTIRQFAVAGYQHQGQQYNATVIRQVIEDITAHIDLEYSQLRTGMRNGLIGVSKSS